MPAGRNSARLIPPWIKVPAALCDPVTVTSGPFVERFAWQSVIQVHDTPSALCPSLFQWQMNPRQNIRTLDSTSGERTCDQGGDGGTGVMATVDGIRSSLRYRQPPLASTFDIWSNPALAVLHHQGSLLGCDNPCNRR